MSTVSGEQKDLIWNAVWPDPVEIKKSRLDENGARSTQILYPASRKGPILLDADAIFVNACSSPEALTSRANWHCILPWIKNTPEEIEVFWKPFDDPDKAAARFAACTGNKYQNWQRERVLLGDLVVIRRLQESSAEREANEETDEQRKDPVIEDYINFARKNGLVLGQLKDQCVEWLLNAQENDPLGLRRLYDLIKNPSADKGVRDDTHSTLRLVIAAFASLLGKEMRLPSKREVRVHAGLGEDPSGTEDASRAMKSLGLSGLPKAT